MINSVKEVLAKSFEEVSASSLVLKLLDCYSKLYINGSQPGICGLCLRNYYTELKKNGMELAKIYEEVKNRTCKPAWNGLKYIPSTARHWNNELITDKDAMYLLEKGFVKENEFEILPSEWGKPIPEEKVIEAFEQRHLPKKSKKKGA
jgi:hypothetical protein